MGAAIQTQNHGTLRTRVRLSDGVELWIDASLDDARNAWRKALAEAQMLEIKSESGAGIIAVNPNQVLYFEEALGPHSNGRAAAGDQRQAAR
jgi:hypothetical protein